MAIFDRNRGLNEPQRLNKKQMEMKIKKEQEESAKRLEDNMPGFKADYNKLVEKYGIVHYAGMGFDNRRGVYPMLNLQECMKEVEAERTRRAGIVKSGVDKKDGGIIK